MGKGGDGWSQSARPGQKPGDGQCQELSRHSRNWFQERWRQWGASIQGNIVKGEKHLNSPCLAWILLFQGSSWVWGSSLSRTRENWPPREQREGRGKNFLQSNYSLPWTWPYVKHSSTTYVSRVWPKAGAHEVVMENRSHIVPGLQQCWAINLVSWFLTCLYIICLFSQFFMTVSPVPKIVPGMEEVLYKGLH